MIVYDGAPDDSGALIQFFRRESPNLRELRKVVVTRSETIVYDVNRDTMQFPGLTYGNPALESLLRELRVVFNAATLHDPNATPSGVKEYRLSARHAWGEDRVG